MKHGAETLLILLFDLALIIAVARLFGALARKIGQPAVIGEIVAGIVLGPTILGRISSQLPAQLFPPTVPLRPLADLGLIFFMFLVGLELSQLNPAVGRRAFGISLNGAVFSVVLGGLIALPLFPLNNGGRFAEAVLTHSSRLTFALFMGAAMCVTAFTVLGRILIERDLYKSSIGTTALSAAAVNDVIGWILLAGAVAVARSGSLVAARYSLILIAVFAGFLLLIVRRLIRLLAKRYDMIGRLTVDQLAVVVVGLLLSAYATEWIGVHAVFGAFLFGSIMPQHSRMTRELTEKIGDFTGVVLLPVFFTVAGLRTNLFAINSRELFLWTLVVVGAGILGKLVGCGLAARLNGFSVRDSIKIGTLMNTRGPTVLVMLSIGLSLGVLSDRTFAMMVLMTLVTTVISSGAYSSGSTMKFSGPRIDTD